MEGFRFEVSVLGLRVKGQRLRVEGAGFTARAARPATSRPATCRPPRLFRRHGGDRRGLGRAQRLTSLYSRNVLTSSGFLGGRCLAREREGWDGDGHSPPAARLGECQVQELQRPLHCLLAPLRQPPPPSPPPPPHPRLLARLADSVLTSQAATPPTPPGWNSSSPVRGGVRRCTRGTSPRRSAAPSPAAFKVEGLRCEGR